MKSKGVAVALALFLGGIGMHKFYLDRPGQGIVYALFFWTLIPAMLAIVDIIIMLTMSKSRWENYTA